MASKSVRGTKGDVGLDRPAPKRRRRNTTLVDNARRGSMSAARKQSAGKHSDAEIPKQPKRRAGMSAPAADAGSEVGRRVGRSMGNIKRAQARPEKKRRDKPVDTSKPGVAADDKRVGGSHTARRNTKLNMAGMTATLEDSRTTPSRKSTRRSANRQKPNQLTKRAQRRVTSPKARATRSRATAG